MQVNKIYFTICFSKFDFLFYIKNIYFLYDFF